MTLKEKIVGRITELEGIVASSQSEIESLTNQLRDTPDALLERDDQAHAKAMTEKMNDFLRREGLLPSKE